MTRQSPATFIAYEALEAHRRVKFHTGTDQLEYADAAEDFEGVTQESAAAGEGVSIELKRAATGTVEIEAAGVITAGATIYGAVDGKVSASSTGNDKFGKAIEAASGDGAVIEAIIDD